MNSYVKTVAILCLCVVAMGCPKKTTYTPKPKGYPRIEFPTKTYTVFDSTSPYRFEIPGYSRMEFDPRYTIKKDWYNLSFIPFNATLHISYLPISSAKELDMMVEDSRKLVYKHTIKADDITELALNNGDKSNPVSGMFYELTGNTATPLNFYLTDNDKHFFRGALYFNAKTESDSIKPVYEFIKTDILHMIKTFHWQ